jgi:hypothetical protein
MITMRPVEDERGFRKFALGDVEFSVDVLPPELRIKWDILCQRIEAGENDLSGALKAVTRQVTEAIGPEILFRAAHRNPQTNGAPGLAEKSAVRLVAPPGRLRTEVWTNSGRRLTPDEGGIITITPGEAPVLLANGWTYAKE